MSASKIQQYRLFCIERDININTANVTFPCVSEQKVWHPSVHDDDSILETDENLSEIDQLNVPPRSVRAVFRSQEAAMLPLKFQVLFEQSVGGFFTPAPDAAEVHIRLNRIRVWKALLAHKSAQRVRKNPGVAGQFFSFRCLKLRGKIEHCNENATSTALSLERLKVRTGEGGRRLATGIRQFGRCDAFCGEDCGRFYARGCAR